MDPNSTHQLWSRWTAMITVPFSPVHVGDAFKQEMVNACARFYRKLFGSATELKIDSTFGAMTHLTVDCRTEGSPTPDPVFRRRQMAEIANFFGKNLRRYGKVDVRIDVRVEAGDVGNGKPPSQLILAPPLFLQ